MIAASPNWRSRSSSSVRLPECFASEAARFVAIDVLPVPPFGAKTVTILPCRAWPPWAASFRPAWLALRIAKTTLSVSCGSSRTSETSASSASSSSVAGAPAARTITGAAGRRLVRFVRRKEELLGLVVGDGEHDLVLRVEAAAELARAAGRPRGAHHLDVPQDDLRRRVREPRLALAAQLVVEVGDDVDVVAGLQDPRQDLVRGACDLVRAEGALQAALDEIGRASCRERV